jgi:hypothetical protein
MDSPCALAAAPTNAEPVLNRVWISAVPIYSSLDVCERDKHASGDARTHYLYPHADSNSRVPACDIIVPRLYCDVWRARWTAVSNRQKTIDRVCHVVDRDGR